MYKESKLEKRARIIQYLYQFELLEKELTSVEAFENGNYSPNEIKIIESIAKNYESLKKLVSKFLKATWSWERISPLERSILLYGAFELAFTDKALIINELILITKGYIPGDSYKFINAILANVGAYYEKIKKA